MQRAPLVSPEVVESFENFSATRNARVHFMGLRGTHLHHFCLTLAIQMLIEIFQRHIISKIHLLENFRALPKKLFQNLRVDAVLIQMHLQQVVTEVLPKLTHSFLSNSDII